MKERNIMGKIWLSPLIDVVLKNNKIYICEDDIYTIEYDQIIYDVLKMLKRGCEETEIYSTLGKEKGMCLLESLKDMNFIKLDVSNKYVGTIFEKQIEYFYSCTEDANKAQENLQKKAVCIIGVGGIGTVAIQHLVAAGIEKFLFIDGDVIRIDNFNRQMIYKISQIGEKKVQAAKEYVMEINSNAEVLCIDKFIESEDDLSILDDAKIDFVICGADKPYNKIQIMISNYCKKRNIPSIYANVGINMGNWGPIIVPDRDVSYEHYLRKVKTKMNEDERIISTVERQPLSASFGITNTIVGAYMTFEVIKYLIGTNTETGILYAIDFLNYKISEENINAE